MKVVALELGFDNVSLRNPGEVFEMPDDVFEGGGKHWFEPEDPAVKAAVAAARKPGHKAEVAAVDPSKQTADKQSADEKLAKEQAKKARES